MANKAVIPLYINTDILNNLFTIVIQEFVEIKSISTKDVVTVHVKSPISEFSYDIFGRYIQGDLELVLQNEYMKQRTEEKISTVIVMLKKLRDILNTQGILKQVDKQIDFSSVEVSDYIEFTAQLQPNPILKKVGEIVDYYEIENMLSNEEKEDKRNINGIKDLIHFLKKGLVECRNEKCIRYIGYPTAQSSTLIVIPMKNSCMLEYEDYLLNGNVSIMGKVVRKHSLSDRDDVAVSLEKKQANNVSLRKRLFSDTVFDNIDLGRLAKRIDERFPGMNISSSNDDVDLKGIDYVIEIIPISIAI